MTSRIAETFSNLAAAGRKAFVPFVTAGDPDVRTSIEIIRALARAGAAIIEIGVPFSDPMADGPTIQKSSQRAIAAGVSLSVVLEIVREFRRSSEVPVVLFSYLNPIFRFGINRFCREAADAKIDGLLLTDVQGAPAVEISHSLAGDGIDLISLAAPTSTDERLSEIARNARGFIYAVSRTGVTGAQADAAAAAPHLVARLRRFTSMPIAVGFGISTARQIRDVWSYADGAVVGSAIVAEIENNIAGDPIAAVERFTAGLLPQIAFRRPQV